MYAFRFLSLIMVSKQRLYSDIGLEFRYSYWVDRNNSPIGPTGSQL